MRLLARLFWVLVACPWFAGCSNTPAADAGMDLDADGAPGGDEGSHADSDDGSDAGPDAGADGDAGQDGDGDAGGYEAPACCAADLNCPAGLECLSRADVDDICVLPAGAGECWTDEDCPPAEPVCAGMSVCPCDAGPCAFPVTPGTCEPRTQPGCCQHDAQCEGGLICARPPAHDGKCVPPPPPGACFSFDDCTAPNAVGCDGAVVCACFEVCDYAPGTCLEENRRPCCAEDQDCLDGRCHHGACLADTPTGCWSDSDCAPGSFCSGEAICPCGSECQEGDDIPGECLALPTGCCNADGDCGAGEACRGADPDLVPGRCLPEAGDNGCWDGLDCPESHWPDYCCYCSGASFCPCVEACPDCGIVCGDDALGWCNCGDCI